MTIENYCEDLGPPPAMAEVDSPSKTGKIPALAPSKNRNGLVVETLPALVRAEGTVEAVPRRKALREEQRKKQRAKVLPEKEFKTRPSLMTRMLQLDDYAGMYNIFAAVVINLTIYTIISDLYHDGSINLGMANVFAMFGKPLPTWTLLTAMHFASAVPFYWTFRTWAENRSSFLSVEGVWDLSFSILLVLFVYGFYYIPIQVHWMYKLPPASATMIVLEQLRLTMKLYAFLRSNVPRVLESCEEDYLEESHSSRPRNLQSSHLDKENNLMHLPPKNQRLTSQMGEETAGGCGGGGGGRNNKEVDGNGDRSLLNSPWPEFEHFLFFLYAPTLVYRDSYPRTEGIRWGFVMTNFIEFLGCIYMYNLVHHLSGYVLVQNFGVVSMGWYDLVRFMFFQMITGGLGFVLGFFILLQTTQNISAELLRFGDRQFYLDWWNSDSFGAFYRKWNLPVQDFLYTYIYKEAKEASLDRVNRILPSILVFLISSVFHEYVLMYVLQVCYPLLLLLFGGLGMLLSFIPNRGSRHNGNLFFWWSLITGNGLIHGLYTLEYFARSNGCPPAPTPMQDFFIPRSWTCGAVGSS